MGTRVPARGSSQSMSYGPGESCPDAPGSVAKCREPGLRNKEADLPPAPPAARRGRMAETDQASAARRFPARNAAIIAAGVPAALFLYRPFGLSIDNGAEALVLALLAPVNFAALMAIHMAPLPRGPARAVIAAAAMTAVNALYLSAFSATGAGLLVQAPLVGIAAFAIIFIWQRQVRLAEEVETLRAMPAPAAGDLTFRGEGDREILKAPATAVRYAKAEGNYVRIVWMRDGAPAEILLRTRLADIETAGEGALVRCHRSWLVNLSAAERVEGGARGMTVHFPEGMTAPVSRNHVAAVRAAIGD